MININEILSFLQVVRSGSFQAASREFGTPKSTLSRQVAHLETRLGVSLLHRTTRKISLTPAGESLFLRTSNILDQVNEAEAELRSEQLGLSGTIRLTAPVDMGPALLAKPLAEFKEKFPLIAIDLLLTDQVINLAADRFDLALRVGNLSDSNFKSRKLRSHQMVLAATPAYLIKYGHPKEPSDLLRHTLIGFSPTLSATVWELAKGQSASGENPKGSHFQRIEVPRLYSMSSFAMCLALAKESMGIALIPQFMLKNSVLTGELEILLPDWHTEPRPISLVWPHQEKAPARLRALIDHLAERL